MTVVCVDSSPEHVTNCHVQLTDHCNLTIPHQHSLTTLWTHLTWQLHTTTTTTTTTSYCSALKHYLQHVSTFSESECYNHQALFPWTAHQNAPFSYCCKSYQYKTDSRTCIQPPGHSPVTLYRHSPSLWKKYILEGPAEFNFVHGRTEYTYTVRSKSFRTDFFLNQRHIQEDTHLFFFKFKISSIGIYTGFCMVVQFVKSYRKFLLLHLP